MANLCRTTKRSTLIDIKLEEISETGELWADEGGKSPGQRNNHRRGLETHVKEQSILYCVRNMER